MFFTILYLFLKITIDIDRFSQDVDKHTRIRIESWCKKLCQVTNNFEWRKNRNLHAISLLDMVINNRYEEPYNKFPDDGPLILLSKPLILSKLSKKFWYYTKYLPQETTSQQNPLQSDDINYFSSSPYYPPERSIPTYTNTNEYSKISNMDNQKNSPKRSEIASNIVNSSIDYKPKKINKKGIGKFNNNNPNINKISYRPKSNNYKKNTSRSQRNNTITEDDNEISELNNVIVQLENELNRQDIIIMNQRNEKLSLIKRIEELEKLLMNIC